MKSLYSYLDYQKFLRDYYEERKEETTFFSYRFFGNRLGLDAGFLVKVLQGKMHLALKSIPRVVAYFHFDKHETEYFEILVRYQRSTSPREIKLYFENLLSLRDLPVKTIEETQYEFYRKWYYSAIRALIGIYDFNGDFAALGKRLSPPISAREAKKAVALLDRLQLINKNDQGRYCLTDKFISADGKWKTAAIRVFQQEALRLAQESLDRHPASDRDVSTITLAVSHKDLEEIKECASDFRRSLMHMTNDNKADCVYQVNVQIVPLTSIPRERT
jgi:uncharacterized protein (TIGR02147 family)